MAFEGIEEERLGLTVDEELESGIVYTQFMNDKYLSNSSAVLIENTATTIELRKGIYNARTWREHLLRKKEKNDKGFGEVEKYPSYELLGILEKALEKYVKESCQLDGDFNIFMYSDEEIEDLIKKAKEDGVNIPEMTDSAKKLRRKKYDCGKYKPQDLPDDAYVCV